MARMHACIVCGRTYAGGPSCIMGSAPYMPPLVQKKPSTTKPKRLIFLPCPPPDAVSWLAWSSVDVVDVVSNDVSERICIACVVVAEVQDGNTSQTDFKRFT